MNGDCGNDKCSDHDVEYAGACSSFYRHSSVISCPSYKPYKPPDPNRYKESYEQASKYLDDINNSGRNGEIVRRLKALLASRKSIIFKREELEELIK